MILKQGLPTSARLSRMGAVLLAAELLAGCGFGGAPPQHAKSSKSSRQSAVFSPLNQAPRPMTITRNGNHVMIQMYAEETEVTIAAGVRFPAWTFDGTVPGPVINLRAGDHVTLTLHNLDPRMPHAIDLHSALVPPNQDFVPVLPGHSKTFHFVASQPGVFLYHCESSPMPLHIAQGMYGAVVVTPVRQKPPLYTLVQSEFYRPDSLASVLNAPPRYVVFNGVANRYAANPLAAPVSKPFTVAVVDAGPNEFSAFHVVGSMLRDVQASGNPRNNLYGVQTYTIAPGDGALIQLEFNQAGQYSFVSHAMNQLGKGAYGIFDAGALTPPLKSK